LPPTIQRIAKSFCRHSASVILVSGKATKYQLPEQSDQLVPTIFASACVRQTITRHRRQSQHVVEFAIGKQPGIGGHHGAAKLEN
jgi:hypothetical protein